MSDHGPWRAGVDNECDLIDKVYIESLDFTHDVRLYVNGDFTSEEDKLLYAKDIARQLNGVT